MHQTAEDSCQRNYGPQTGQVGPLLPTHMDDWLWFAPKKGFDETTSACNKNEKELRKLQILEGNTFYKLQYSDV